ncbi:glycoside hydrolase family 3 N-terminal domain-containing protein [Megasphaera paucivorans]|uniref:beta-N-acetylhexosaminidase n=1 Tax=Megasphaera paucivorans TaxID=349095 RepID=A0A1G9R3B4_9FIRM|nr:glycoside hydrolase family 3 N-terminal domain-containing protein [Megasphaera paucivorans]SDM17620.1 beta-N-acetylhexosaminidase [Megasphaera paucivorans]
MKMNKVIASIVMISMTVCFSGCKQEVKNEAQPAVQHHTINEQAKQIVARMSDTQKIGQLMMIGITGPVVDIKTDRALAKYKFGNVILFDRNMQNQNQVKKLTADLQEKISINSGIFPFIALDQEGGAVLRMRSHFPEVPSEQELGRKKPSETKIWAETTGKELKEMGININFSPVVDLGLSHGRSYSDDPGVVSTYAEQACTGYKDAGILCVLKHFPGIGKAEIDPHMDGASVAVGREQLEQEDLKPFRDLIQRIDNKNMFVMVSNVTFPALDTHYPACVSEKIMTDILRNQYGYKGLILTDDMEMGAMSKHYTFSQMGVMAVKAGADIILVCHDYEHEQEVYKGLLKAYRSGELSRDKIDKKVLRIVEMKLAYNGK